MWSRATICAINRRNMVRAGVVVCAVFLSTVWLLMGAHQGSLQPGVRPSMVASNPRSDAPRPEPVRETAAESSARLAESFENSPPPLTQAPASTPSPIPPEGGRRETDTSARTIQRVRDDPTPDPASDAPPAREEKPVATKPKPAAEEKDNLRADSHKRTPARPAPASDGEDTDGGSGGAPPDSARLTGRRNPAEDAGSEEDNSVMADRHDAAPLTTPGVASNAAATGEDFANDEAAPLIAYLRAVQRAAQSAAPAETWAAFRRAYADSTQGSLWRDSGAVTVPIDESGARGGASDDDEDEEEPAKAKKDDKPFAIMDLLWNVLRNGQAPDTPSDDEASNKAEEAAKTMWQAISDALPDGSVLTLGQPALGRLAARGNADRTVVSLVARRRAPKQPAAAPGVWEPFTPHFSHSGIPNNIVCDVDAELLRDLVRDLHQDPTVMFGAAIIGDLTPLLETFLPHELEETLGRLLSMASESFVVGLPRGDPNPFFDAWDGSVTKLIERSSKVTGLAITVHDVTVSRQTNVLFRVILNESARHVNSGHCGALFAGLPSGSSVSKGQTVTGSAACVLFYRRTDPEELSPADRRAHYWRQYDSRLKIKDDDVAGPDGESLFELVGPDGVRPRVCGAIEPGPRINLGVGNAVYRVDADALLTSVPLHALVATGLATPDAAVLFRSLLELDPKAAAERPTHLPSGMTVPRAPKPAAPAPAPAPSAGKTITKSSSKSTVPAVQTKPRAKPKPYPIETPQVVVRGARMVQRVVLDGSPCVVLPPMRNETTKGKGGKDVVATGTKSTAATKGAAKTDAKAPAGKTTDTSKVTKEDLQRMVNDRDNEEEDNERSLYSMEMENEDDKGEVEPTDETGEDEAPPKEATWGKNSRVQQVTRRTSRRLLVQPLQYEEALFNGQWNVLREELGDSLDGKSSQFTLMAYGSHVSLLAAKIAKSYPLGTVLAVIPSFETDAFRRHEALLESTHAVNVLPFRGDLNPPTVSALRNLPERVRFQVLGLEVFEHLLTLKGGFGRYLGETLSLASTTFIEVPSPDALVRAVKLFATNGGKRAPSMEVASLDGMIQAALSLVGVSGASVRLLGDSTGAASGRALVRIDLGSYEHDVAPPFTAATFTLRHRSGGVLEIVHREDVLPHSLHSVSLAFVLTLGPEPALVKRLFGAYLTVPLHEDMHPVNLILSAPTKTEAPGAALYHRGVTGETGLSVSFEPAAARLLARPTVLPKSTPIMRGRAPKPSFKPAPPPKPMAANNDEPRARSRTEDVTEKMRIGARKDEPTVVVKQAPVPPAVVAAPPPKDAEPLVLETIRDRDRRVGVSKVTPPPININPPVGTGAQQAAAQGTGGGGAKPGTDEVSSSPETGAPAVPANVGETPEPPDAQLSGANPMRNTDGALPTDPGTTVAKEASPAPGGDTNREPGAAAAHGEEEVKAKEGGGGGVPAFGRRLLRVQREDPDRERQRLTEIASMELHIRMLLPQLSPNYAGNYQSLPRFSFLDYGSGYGNISLAVAKAYPTSTVVSLERREHAGIASHFAAIKADNVSNNVIGTRALAPELIRSFFESPEFLRFQHVPWAPLQQLVRSLGTRNDFNVMMGEMLTKGMSSFLQLPSAAMVSLAVTTFFPRLHPPTTDLPATALYLRDAHPLFAFDDAELRMVSESARAGKAHVEVEAHLVESHGDGLPDGVHPWWALLRVNLRNLTLEVNHHFDYQLDGHQRRYTFRVETNATHWVVGLQRQKDGFVIPWDSVESVTLICLLRLRLLPEISDAFYDMFMKLPLYEDMAPWNIVYRGGRLAYIDYDTKDVTFDAVAPTAFQVMFMLMNYERTVKDFGHCGQKTKVLYGMPFVGNCVGSQFNGPCEDTRFPVACGDGTCRTTYIECLQALNDMERKRDADLSVFKDWQKVSKHDNSATLNGGAWSFGSNGVKNEVSA